jgi:hypothetical protein
MQGRQLLSPENADAPNSGMNDRSWKNKSAHASMAFFNLPNLMEVPYESQSKI